MHLRELLPGPGAGRVRQQLLWPMFTLMAVALLALVVGVSQVASSLVERQARETAQVTAERYAEGVRLQLESDLATSIALAEIVEGMSSAGASRAAADSALRKLLVRRPELLGTWLGFEPNAYDGRDAAFAHDRAYYDETGRFFPGWVRDPEAGGAISKDTAPEDHEYEKPGEGDWYLLPTRTGRDVLLDPYFYKVAGREVLETSICTPIRRDGRIVGVAGVDFSLKDLQQTLSAIRPYGGGFAALIAANGTYVTHPRPELLGQPLETKERAANFKRALEQERTLLTREGGGGGDYFTAYVPFHVGSAARPWVFVLAVQRSHALVQAARLRGWTLAIGLAAFGILALLVVVLRGLFATSRKLESLAEESRQERDTAMAFLADTRQVLSAVAGGDLRVRMEGEYAGAYAEIRDLMNRTTAALQEIVAGARATTSSVTQSAARIRAGSQAIAELAVCTSSGAQAAAESSVATGEHVHSVAEAAQAMSGTIQAIATDLEAASTASEQAQEKAQAVVALVDHLGSSSKSIGDVLGLIDAIARRINLIALNAAIEAARAGEHGRAFSVIADEVTKLSSQTSVRTGDIARMVGAVQTDVATTIDGIREISDVIARLNSVSAQVAAAMREQTRTTGIIAQSMSEAARGTAGVSDSIAAVSEAAVKTAVDAEEFSDASAELAGVAGELDQRLEAFSV